MASLTEGCNNSRTLTYAFKCLIATRSIYQKKLVFVQKGALKIFNLSGRTVQLEGPSSNFGPNVGPLAKPFFVHTYFCKNYAVVILLISLTFFNACWDGANSVYVVYVTPPATASLPK